MKWPFSGTIAEVALQCGYDYTPHFCTAFKRKFGVSPRTRRRQQ
ncbi:MAG: hypothetical protein CR994_07540 [Maribacter sp.]|nr:MAG: hypothetical protein CR994_07540 [Maribacter sp.]